jgi:hypothetical protein
MFKLIKITNAGVNVPELIKMNKQINSTIKMGMLLSTNSQGNIINCPLDERPKYVSAADALAGKTEIVCYEITPNMHFETELFGDPYEVKVGMKVSLACDEDDNTGYISTSTSPEIATICDMSETKKYGDKITVKFD